MLAGPNGAGKSTLYRALVRGGIISADLTFVNADLYERDHLQHMLDPEQRSQAAGEWAELVAICEGAQTSKLVEPVPQWVQRVLGEIRIH